jgi:hypothetical protein
MMPYLNCQSHDLSSLSRRRRSVLPFVAALVSLTSAADAAVLQVDGPHAIGIREFAMDGKLYSVHFDDRSFDEIVADPAYRDPFPFLGTDFQTVEPVLDALNGLLVGAGVERLRDPDSSEAVFRGIIPTREISAALPAHFVGRENQFLGGDWRIAVGGGGVGFDREDPAGQHGRVFIVFAPVPEPASVTLAAGMALLAVAAGRRWRARKPGLGAVTRT